MKCESPVVEACPLSLSSSRRFILLLLGKALPLSVPTEPIDERRRTRTRNFLKRAPHVDVIFRESRVTMPSSITHEKNTLLL